MLDDSDAGDAARFNEVLRADTNTLRARRWASDLFASHAALKSAVWELYGARLKECFRDEAKKIHDEAFETIRALVDASGRDDSASLRIRFHCPAWMAQQFKSRTLFPKDSSQEEKRRIRGRLERQWNRTGWKPLNLLQSATGLPFFRREVEDFSPNIAPKAAAYVNEYTDLLLDTRHRARAFRHKHTVWKYEQAARVTLRAYAERKDFRHYAPEWRPPAPATPATPKEETDEQEPTAKVESIASRSAAKAAKIIAELPAEEADACALLFVERAAQAWEKQTGREWPLSAPVLRRTDNEKTTDAAGPTSCVSAPTEDCEIPSKAEENTPDHTDNLSAIEALEFEPYKEPRGVSLADAEAAAHACISVGAERLKVVFIDDTKERGDPGSCTLAEDVTPAELLQKLPAYLERNRRSPVESFTVRLRRKEDTRLIQLDDCPPEVVERLSSFAFLVHATSPGNAQAWLALADEFTHEQYDELRYRLLNGPLKATGTNGGAYGSTRWPGSLNRKPKRRYADGESPRVQLLRISAGRRVTVAELEATGLLAAPRPKPSAADMRAIRSRLPDPKDWPDMNQYLAECDGDRSRAESKWCVRAISMGHPLHAVEAELERIGEKARVRRRDNYVRETVENAAQWVGMNPRREVAPSPHTAPARVRGTI